jgi:hypothetical protein
LSEVQARADLNRSVAARIAGHGHASRLHDARGPVDVPGVDGQNVGPGRQQRLRSRFPGRAVISCRPEALVFLERHRDAASQLRPLDVDSALGRLLKDIHVSETPVIERHRQTLERLLQTKIYTLSYSGDPTKAVEVIRSILHNSDP